MRRNLSPQRHDVPRLRKVLLAACAFLLPGAYAAPSIDPLEESQVNMTSGCQFRIPSAAKSQGRIVLQLNAAKASLRISGQPITLDVKKEECKDCWYPGKSGVKVFSLTNRDVRATAMKPVTCSRDAEVCSGIHKGEASLVVVTAAGSKTVSVWNDDCDF